MSDLKAENARKEETIAQLMEKWGGRYSKELGIDIESGRSGEIFKWFLASILFGARISQVNARQTYYEFEKCKVITPDAIIGTGWDGLVEILDTGGYTRYDFKTATKLLEIMQMLNDVYGGDLNILHEKAHDPEDLESKLMEFKGVGPVTVNIFLRELRGIWEKAQPLPGDPVIIAARRLGLTDMEGKNEEERKMLLIELKSIWEKASLPYRFSDFEAALVKLGIYQRLKRPEEQAPVR
jgi:endonuclease III